MSKFLHSLGIAESELRLLDATTPTSSPTPPSLAAEELAQLCVSTGEFHQGTWRLPSDETVGFELVSWEPKSPGPEDLWRLPEVDTALPGSLDETDDPLSPLSTLPVECLARVAANLSLADLAAVCAVSPAFRCLVRGDACWVERLRSHFGRDHLRGCYPVLIARDRCCPNPFARFFFHVLFGLYRARPECVDQQQQDLEQQDATQALSLLSHQRLTPERSMSGALFQQPLLSPVLIGRPLLIDFLLPGVHPGRYDILLRVKKLQCNPLDSESVANAAGSSGVRVPLLQARINRRSVTISNFECTIEVTSCEKTDDEQQRAAVFNSETVSHLLQNYSMPPERWFYWRLAFLDLFAEDAPKDLRIRVSVMRRGLADTTVTQEEFERELRNALLIDHLFLRLQQNPLQAC